MINPILLLSDYYDGRGIITEAYITKRHCEVVKFKTDKEEHFTATRYPINKKGKRTIVLTKVTTQR